MCRYLPGAKMRISSLRQPGYPFQDPWLCVTRLLWFCPFGEPFFSVNICLSNAPKNCNYFFWFSQIFFCKIYRACNKKRARSSSEDESAPCVGDLPGAKTRISSLRQPGYPFIQDPWLCVTRSLWFCPFGEPFSSMNFFYHTL